MSNHILSVPSLVLLAVVFTGIASFVSIHLLYDSYRATAPDPGVFTQATQIMFW